MNKNLFKENSFGALSLLELILVLAIMLFLGIKALNAYFKKPAMDENSEKILSEQGIDTSNYSTIVNSARTQVQYINNRMIKRTDALDAIK